MRKPSSGRLFGVRALRGCLILVAGAGIMMPVAGCHHRRSAMRPAFSGTRLFAPRSAAPCPSGDCGGTVIQTSPSASEPLLLDNAPMPLNDNGVERSSGSAQPAITPPNNPSDGLSEEPILEPATPGYNSSGSRESLRPNNSTSRGPRLEGPSVSSPPRSSARRSTVPTRPATLRKNVQAYVNDPVDLFTPPRADRPWQYIVLHHSAHAEGSLRQIDQDHKERLGTNGCGYHFIVGNGSDNPDGEIEVAPRWSEQKPGQHCRDSRVARINDDGIGICLIGNLDDTAATQRQIEATRALIAYLADRYDIPPANIVTHDAIAQTATACPGHHFPYQALLGRDRTLARAR